MNSKNFLSTDIDPRVRAGESVSLSCMQLLDSLERLKLLLKRPGLEAASATLLEDIVACQSKLGKAVEGLDDALRRI
jgi:hypothetical protein